MKGRGYMLIISQFLKIIYIENNYSNGKNFCSNKISAEQTFWILFSQFWTKIAKLNSTKVFEIAKTEWMLLLLWDICAIRIEKR